MKKKIAILVVLAIATSSETKAQVNTGWWPVSYKGYYGSGFFKFISGQMPKRHVNMMRYRWTGHEYIEVPAEELNPQMEDLDRNLFIVPNGQDLDADIFEEELF